MTVIDTSAIAERLEWQLAQVRDILAETHRVKSFILEPVNWTGHLPGQHVDIRLTAADGYQAQRSYSIASPPEDKLLTVTVERVTDGEVSPYLLDELRVGDRLELRGPIARHFVWTSGSSWLALSYRGRNGHYAADGDASPSRPVIMSYPDCPDLFSQKPGRSRLSGRTRWDGA